MYCAQRGRARILLGCPFPHGYQNVAQLLSSSWRGCVSPPFIWMNLECPLVPGDLEQLLVLLLIRAEAAHLPDHVPHALVCSGEVPTSNGCASACSCLRSQRLLQPTATCSSVADAAEAVIMLNKYMC